MRRRIGLCTSKKVRNFYYSSSVSRPVIQPVKIVQGEKEGGKNKELLSLPKIVTDLNKSNISQLAIAEVIRNDEEKLLQVHWANGVKSRFLYVWLRDNCPEKHTYNLSSICKARIMVLNDLDVEIEPLQVENLGDRIYVLWPNDKTAYYESSWLQQRDLDNRSLRDKRQEISLDDKILWNAAKLNGCMNWIPFDRILSDELTLHDTLTNLCKLGIVFINDAPPKLGQLKILASKIGFEYLTHYGHFFVVKSNSNPTNVAYRTGALGFHTDLPYLQYAPQVQALHCIEQVKSTGGENQFVDAFYVAQEFSAKYPDFYNILCEVPLEYVDDGQDYIRFDLTYRRPVFNFDSQGRLTDVHFSNQQRSWFYDVPIEKLLDVYRAQKIFNNFLCSPLNKIELKLLPGQMVIFHNLRIMHARSAFNIHNESESRLMEGCYFNLDLIKSKIRVLRDKLLLQPNQISV